MLGREGGREGGRGGGGREGGRKGGGEGGGRENGTVQNAAMLQGTLHVVRGQPQPLPS